MSTPESEQPPQQPQYQQSAPTYAPPTPAQGPVRPKGLAIAAIVTGGVAFLMGLLPIVGAIVGIAGIVLGAIALSKKQPKGLALTGLILGAVAVISSIAVTAGLGALTNEVVKTNETAEIATPAEPEVVEEEPAEPEPETPAVEEQTYTGTGDYVQAVSIDSPAWVEFTCGDCGSHTAVETNGSESLLVNTVGAYSGSHFINTRDGSMTTEFVITAGGSWTLTIKDLSVAPRHTGAVSGTGDSAFIMDSTFTVAAITGTGGGHFAVKGIVDSNLAVNTVGAYGGTVKLEGPNAIQVNSDGDWSITPQ